MIKAQMIFESIAAYPFPLFEDLMPMDHPQLNQDTCRLTVSIAVLGFNHEWIKSIADIMKALDNAVRESAGLGGNRVIFGKSNGQNI